MHAHKNPMCKLKSLQQSLQLVMMAKAIISYSNEVFQLNSHVGYLDPGSGCYLVEGEPSILVFICLMNCWLFPFMLSWSRSCLKLLTVSEYHESWWVTKISFPSSLSSVDINSNDKMFSHCCLLTSELCANVAFSKADFLS